MPEFLTWFEASALGRGIRESGVYAYAVVNTMHVLGVATLFGSILVLDLRLLGVWRRVPLAPVAASTAPVAGIGVVVALASGISLLAVNGSEYIGNPWLLVKFPAILLGVINVAVVRRSRLWRALVGREPEPAEQRRLAVIGGVSLASWLTAVIAGRMIAYW